MSKPKLINSINNTLNNQPYSWKRNFTFTGNTISNKQNIGITSALKKRVLIEPCSKCNNNQKEIPIQEKEDKKEESEDINEDTDLPSYGETLPNGVIIHRFHIFRENHLNVCFDNENIENSYVYFNGLHDFKNLKYGLTTARYRIVGIPPSLPIGLVCDKENVIEVDDGIEHDRIIVNGTKIVTLYRDFLFFKVLKKFENISLVSYYPLNGYNMFYHVNYYDNDVVHKYIEHTEYNNGIHLDDFVLPSIGYTIECIYYDICRTKQINFMDNYNIKNDEQLKNHVLKYKDNLSLTYDFANDLNENNIDDYINKIDYSNFILFTFNSTTKYELNKKYGLFKKIYFEDNEKKIENGSYSFTCPKEYPITFLNKNKEHLIRMYIDEDSESETTGEEIESGSINELVNGEEYTFYYGEVSIEVFDDFSNNYSEPMSMCVYNTFTKKIDYMGLKDKFIYTNKCDYIFQIDFDYPGIPDDATTNEDELSKLNDKIKDDQKDRCQLHFPENKKINDTRGNIKIENISFKFDNHNYNLEYHRSISENNNYIFKNINLEIKDGEKVALYNNNDIHKGKTTLSKLISNIYKPNSGVIYLNDKNINNVNTKDKIKYINKKYIDDFVNILDLNQNKMIDYLKKENIYFLLKKYELEEYFNEISSELINKNYLRTILFTLTLHNSDEAVIILDDIFDNIQNEDITNKLTDFLIKEYKKTVIITTNSSKIADPFLRKININELCYKENINNSDKCLVHNKKRSNENLQISKIEENNKLEKKIWTFKKK